MSEGSAQRFGASVMVHETAIVDAGVEIGEGTKIWHFSHLLGNTSIGSNCSIGQNAMLGPDVRVGNGCKIQNNVAVYKGVTLEDDVFCGPSHGIHQRANTARAHQPAGRVSRHPHRQGVNARRQLHHRVRQQCRRLRHDRRWRGSDQKCAGPRVGRRQSGAPDRLGQRSRRTAGRRPEMPARRQPL